MGAIISYITPAPGEVVPDHLGFGALLCGPGVLWLGPTPASVSSRLFCHCLEYGSLPTRLWAPWGPFPCMTHSLGHKVCQSTGPEPGARQVPRTLLSLMVCMWAWWHEVGTLSSVAIVTLPVCSWETVYCNECIEQIAGLNFLCIQGVFVFYPHAVQNLIIPA